MVALALLALLAFSPLALAAKDQHAQEQRQVDAPAQLHNFQIGVVQHLPPSKRARAFSSGVTHDPRSHRIRAVDDDAAAADDLDLTALAVNTTLTRAERIAAIRNATLANQDDVSNSTTTARTVVPLTRNATTSTGSSSRPTGVSSATSVDATISSSTTITASPSSPSSAAANSTSTATRSDSASDSTASARSNATAASAASVASESSSELSVSSSIRFAAITSMLGAIFDTTTTASATPSALANTSSTAASDAEATTTALLPTALSNSSTTPRQAISRSEIPTETSISAESSQVSRGGVVPSSTLDLPAVSATALPSLPLNASSLVFPLPTSTPARSSAPVDTAAARESSIASILSDLFTLTATAASGTPTVSASDSQITASQRNATISRGSVGGDEVTSVPVAASVSSAIASAVSSIAAASANSTREPGVLPSLSAVLSAILSSATAVPTDSAVSRGGLNGTAPTPTRLVPNNPANQTADVSTLTPTATATESPLFPGQTGLLTRLPVNGSSSETVATSPRFLPTTTPSLNATQIVGSVVSSVVSASQSTPSPTSTGESSAANSTESAPSTSTRASASFNSANAWIPTSALIINTPSSSASTSATTTAFVAGATTTTNVNGKPSITITSQVAFPTNLPTKIVPSAAVAELQPVDTTLISILFNQQLSWTWLVSNGNASAQVFAYTPATLADALGVSADQIQTVSLEAFQPATFNGDTDSILTVYLAYIPSNYVDALQAMLKNPNSPLYQQSGVQSQIASLMNPNFSVLAYSGPNAPANGDSSSLSSTGGSSSTNSSGTSSTTIIIAVVVSFGVVMLSLAAFAAYRASTRNAVALPGSRNNERGGGGRSREPSGLRSFQLGRSEHGHNGLARSNSASTTSSASSGSTGYSGSSSNGAPTSRGQADSASPSGDSWWRFSSDSGHGHGHAPQGGEMREHRRINVVRGANGQFDSSTIGRPTIVSNSLML